MTDVRLIDANALQREFDDAHKDEPDFFCCNFLNNAGNPSTEWDCVDDILENAPTIDAQPVKWGHWIATIDGFAPRIECSNCHISSRQNHLLAVSVDGSKLPRFCPNCGADMRGEVDEEK